MKPIVPTPGMLRIAQNIAMKKMNGRILQIEPGVPGKVTVRDCKSIHATVDAWWKKHAAAHVRTMSENNSDKKQKGAR